MCLALNESSKHVGVLFLHRDLRIFFVCVRLRWLAFRLNIFVIVSFDATGTAQTSHYH